MDILKNLYIFKVICEFYEIYIHTLKVHNSNRANTVLMFRFDSFINETKFQVHVRFFQYPHQTHKSLYRIESQSNSRMTRLIHLCCPIINRQISLVFRLIKSFQTLKKYGDAIIGKSLIVHAVCTHLSSIFFGK